MDDDNWWWQLASSNHYSCSVTLLCWHFAKGLSVIIQQNCRGAGHRSSYCFCGISFIFMTYPAVHHILFSHRISMTALVYLILMTLANSHPSIQDAPAPLLLLILQWNLQKVSLRQQHCKTSVLLQHYIQPLSSPTLISASGRGDKNGHTVSKW